jgi:hypothetical protein
VAIGTLASILKKRCYNNCRASRYSTVSMKRAIISRDMADVDRTILMRLCTAMRQTHVHRAFWSICAVFARGLGAFLRIADIHSSADRPETVFRQNDVRHRRCESAKRTTKLMYVCDLTLRSRAHALIRVKRRGQSQPPFATTRPIQSWPMCRRQYLQHPRLRRHRRAYSKTSFAWRGRTVTPLSGNSSGDYRQMRVSHQIIHSNQTALFQTPTKHLNVA